MNNLLINSTEEKQKNMRWSKKKTEKDQSQQILRYSVYSYILKANKNRLFIKNQKDLKKKKIRQQRNYRHKIYKNNLSQQKKTISKIIQKKQIQSKCLPLKAIIQLYKAKAQDLKIIYNQNQLQNFIFNINVNSSYQKTFIKHKFILTDQDLGYFSSKQIVKIFKNYGNQFSQLILDNNEIGNDGLNIISTILDNTQTLAYLSVANNGISPQGVINLIKKMQMNQTIISINLSNNRASNKNRLGIKGCQVLSQFLKKNEILQQLIIQGCNIGQVGFNCLTLGLSKNKGLKYLNLKNNAICVTNQLFKQWLIMKQLDYLSLSDNKLKNSQMQGLKEQFKRRSKQTNILGIKKIDLSYNEFNSLGVSNFLDMIQLNDSIRQIILDRNQLPVLYVQRFLTNNRNLTNLSLKYCELKDTVFQNLSKGLSANNNVIFLNFRGNNLGSSACKSLAQGIEKGAKGLIQINFSKCKIEDRDGAQLISKFVKHPSIKKIDLRQNFLSENSAHALIRLTRQNYNLIEIRIQKNMIDLRSTNIILKCLEANWTKEKQLENKKLTNELEKNKVNIMQELSKNNIFQSTQKHYQIIEQLQNEYQKMLQEKKNVQEKIINIVQIIKQTQNLINQQKKQYQLKKRHQAQIRNAINHLNSMIEIIQSKIDDQKNLIQKLETKKTQIQQSKILRQQKKYEQGFTRLNIPKKLTSKNTMRKKTNFYSKQI